MSHFFCRLNPPRPTFSQDLTAEEALLMAQHAMYWKGLLREGRADLFGLVADPSGGWGVGIANVEDYDDVTKITEADPVILSKRGFSYDIFPMPRGAVVR